MQYLSSIKNKPEPVFMDLVDAPRAPVVSSLLMQAKEEELNCFALIEFNTNSST